jgi:hypothetical protein
MKHIERTLPMQNTVLAQLKQIVRGRILLVGITIQI